MMSDVNTRLQREHHPEAIRTRLEQPRSSYLSSAVLGGIDGAITTFAIVAAAVGGGLPVTVIIVLGFANLLADGFSMAVSNYNAAKSLVDQIARARRTESRHIDEIPEGEREEVRQILERKGLEGAKLADAVDVITHDRRVWIDWMVVEEWGLPSRAPSPMREALATFAAFAFFGIFPLTPFITPGLDPQTMFRASTLVTGFTFAGIGVLKGWVLGSSLWRSGVGTLLTGGAAATLAYVSGSWLRSWLETTG